MNRLPFELRGRTAIVTGAASGIGRALALAAARRRMIVVPCDRDATRLAEVDEQCHQLGAGSRPVAGDLADPVSLEGIARALRPLPPPALLFANAGVLRSGSVLETSMADWRLLFDVNLMATVQLLQRFLPALVRRGERAQVVITGSTGSMALAPGLAGYCATKHALWAVADALREELAGTSVGVSLLMPGAVATHIFDAVDPNRSAPADSISPDAAAEMAFEGALADRPLILTHPHFVERARARFDTVLADLRDSCAEAA